MHVRDLRTGKDLPDTAERVASIAWTSDNKTLYYGGNGPEQVAAREQAPRSLWDPTYTDYALSVLGRR